MIKVIGYYRYSSDAQRETSIEIQKEIVEKYCADNHLVLVKSFADYAKSGSTTAGRDDFKAMKQYLFDNDDISGVVVYKLDRLSRNTADSLKFMDDARRREKFIQATQDKFAIKMTAEEKFKHTITAAVAELELSNIRDRTRNGSLYKARQGPGSLGGKPPLGYLRPDPDKPLIIDAKNAEIVKKIFDLYVNQGKGYGEIARELNNNAFLTQRKREFGKNSIRDILTNERYTGTEVYNRAAPRKIGRDGQYHYNTHKSKPDAEIIRHENAHDAIISKDLFEKAQEILNSKSRCGGTKSSALFSGIIRCSICESPMHLNSNSTKSKKGKKYIIRKYRCNCYNNGKIHGRVDADIAEIQTLRVLKEGLFYNLDKKEFISELDLFFKSSSSTYKQLELHQTKLDEYNKKIERLTRAIEDSNSSQAIRRMAAQIDALEKNVEDIECQIKILQQLCRREYTELDIQYIIDNFERLVMENAKKLETKEFLHSYIKKVAAGEDTLDIEIEDTVIPASA